MSAAPEPSSVEIRVLQGAAGLLAVLCALLALAWRRWGASVAALHTSSQPAPGSPRMGGKKGQ